jgi:C-terminal processing protease CtpA/Prc
MRVWILAIFFAAFVGVANGEETTAAASKNTDAATRLYSPEELREDLDQMYRGLQAAHFDLYAFTTKAELERRYRQTRASLRQPLTLLQAKTQFQLFAAAVRMGHTRVDSPAAEWRRYRKDGGKGFPLQIRIVDEHVYIAENLSGLDGIKPGDEIKRMDGQSMQQWLARTERHVSAETTAMAHSLMEYDFAMYVWLELGAAEGFDIAIARSGAPPHRLRLPARTGAQMDAARAAQPPGLDLEHPLRDARIIEHGVAYLRPGPFYNAEAKTEADAWDVSSFRDFIDRSFGTFEAAHADRLIIDLRGNPGGDNLFSDVMVSWFANRPFRFASQFKIKVSEASIAANQARIDHDAAAAGPISRQFAQLYARSRTGDIVDFDIPLTQPRPGARFEGKVFVLIDRQSYSNAVAVAALVQDYGFGTILGEATSDMATTFGAMEQFGLTHTGLSVGFPKARIVRPNGDLRSRGVTPDKALRIPIVQSPADEVLREAAAIATNG